MNIFSLLLKPFMPLNNKQENIDFEKDPSIHDKEKTNMQPVMCINASIPQVMTISAPHPSMEDMNAYNNIDSSYLNRRRFTPFCIENVQSWPSFSFKTANKVGILNEKRCKKSQTSSIPNNLSNSSFTKPLSFLYKYKKIVPEEITNLHLFASKMRKVGQHSQSKPRAKWEFSIRNGVKQNKICDNHRLKDNRDTSNDPFVISKGLNEQNEEYSDSIQKKQLSTLIHPYQIFLNTLFNDDEEDHIDNYDFHCINVSENLKPYIKKHNNLIDNIRHINTYNNLIDNNTRSISCPDIVNMPWKPPQKHGLNNSPKIIPDYYFQSYQNLQKLCDNNIIQIDYLFMIKDDIRNMRKLNQYQINYIQTLDEHNKNEIINEFHKIFNVMIETINLINSQNVSPSVSEKNLLNRTEDIFESESNIRHNISRTTSI